MIIKKQKKIMFNNVANCIVNYEDLENAILWYANGFVINKKKIFISAKYPAVSIHYEKIHIHRLLVSFWNNKRLKSTEYVHHINGNKLDSSKANLEIIEPSVHQSLHRSGVKLSKEHKRKISIKNRNRKGISYRKDVTIEKINLLLDKGHSINKISEILNCSYTTITKRILKIKNGNNR